MPGPRVGWSSLDMAELKKSKDGSCYLVQKKTITLICTDPDATDSSGDEAPHCHPPMKKKRVVRQIFLPTKPFFATKTLPTSSKTPTTTLSPTKTSLPSSKSPTITLPLAKSSLPRSKIPATTLPLAKTSLPSSKTPIATLAPAKTLLPSSKTPTTTTLPRSKTSSFAVLPMEEEKDYEGLGPLPNPSRKKKPMQKKYRSPFPLYSETNKSSVRRIIRRRKSSYQGQGGERLREEYAISSNIEVDKELPEYSLRSSNLNREVLFSFSSSSSSPFSSSSSSTTTTIDPSLSPPLDGLPDDCLGMLHEYFSTSSSDNVGEGDLGEECEDDDDSLLSFVSEMVSDDVDLLPLPLPPISSSSSSFSEVSHHVEGSALNYPKDSLDILQPLPESTVPVYPRHDLSLVVEGEENEEEDGDRMSPLAAELSLFLDNMSAGSQDLMPDFASNIFDTMGGDFSDLSFDLECESMAWANAPEGCIV